MGLGYFFLVGCFWVFFNVPSYNKPVLLAPAGIKSFGGRVWLNLRKDNITEFCAIGVAF